MFGCIILYLAIVRVDYCQVILYILFNIQMSVEIFVGLGFFWNLVPSFSSNHHIIKSSPSILDARMKWLLFGTTFMVMFYLVAIYLAYETYRELRGALHESRFENIF